MNTKQSIAFGIGFVIFFVISLVVIQAAFTVNIVWTITFVAAMMAFCIDCLVYKVLMGGERDG